MNQHIITIAAMGPDSPGLLTFAAYEAMTQADCLVLRTVRHGVADMLRSRGIAFETLDSLYEDCEDFDELCEIAAKRLIARAKAAQRLCYAVSEPISDATVRALAAALPEGFALQGVGGVPLSACAAEAVIPFGVNTENLRTLTALSLDAHRPEGDCPLVITEIDNAYLAGDVKLWLTDLFDDEMTVYFLENAAQPGAQAAPIALCDLDRQARYDHRTAVLVPAVRACDRRRASYEDLVQVLGARSGPGRDFCALRQPLMEAAQRAAEALAGDDSDSIAQALADVLLQVAQGGCIGAEHRDFTDRDVTSLAVRAPLACMTAQIEREEAVQNAKKC